MIPSQLSRLITIEKEITTNNAVGTPTEAYSFWKQCYANMSAKTGATEYSGEGALPFTRVEFTMRYDPTIDYKCRIKYENQYYEIGHIETMGRNHWIKIRCVVWEGENANG